MPAEMQIDIDDPTPQLGYRFARQHGGGRVAVGDGLDVHGIHVGVDCYLHGNILSKEE
jgi:hypothetical protein